MKVLKWLIVGIGVGVAAYIISNQPGPMDPYGDPDVEDAADQAAFWGSKRRLSGTGSRLAGQVKEGIGRVIGDDEMAGEGAVQQVAGAVEDTVGKVAQAAGETIHNLNQ
jgi:uncharacterized protein YjbJ (UPF0337 family)